MDKSCETLLNFFKGFLTIDKIKAQVGNRPLRKIRTIITKTKHVPTLEE